MNTVTRVTGFVGVLAMVFGGAWAAGAQVGPVGPAGDDRVSTHGSDHGKEPAVTVATSKTDSGVPLPGGLAVAQDGYRLVLADTVLGAGPRSVSFTIEGPDGRPVTAYDVEHEKRLHLIVVRRDHERFQHLHPTLDETTGRWTARAELAPGQWRVFADFAASGAQALTLGSDLLVPGRPERQRPVQERATSVVDGYTVAVAGTLQPGEHSMLTLSVARGGTPVTDLQPYLGAYGHLVALREGDLAYLHVHPGGEPGDGFTQPGPDVEFGAEVPSAGRYHLYFDFKHGGVVRTAHVVLDAPHLAGGGIGTTPGSHSKTDHTH